jgi:RND family efflux transporter MFP subunit
MTTSAPFRSARKFWYLLPIAILLIAGGLLLHFYRLHQAAISPPPEQAPWALQTAVVARGSVAGSIQSVAVIGAPQDIMLSPQIQGMVLDIGPRTGVAVKRRQLLVRIDTREIGHNIAALQQQRSAALADAYYAAKQQVRIDSVLAEGGVSQSQADQARTATAGADAKVQALTDQIAVLQVNLGYAEIRAPQDAVVADRLVEVGNTVGPGKPVYHLTAGKGAVVRVSLPDTEMARVHVGDTLYLQQDTTTVRLSITRVAPAVNAAGLGTVEADAPLTPFGLPIGSTVAATVWRADSRETLTVPMTAVIGGGTGAHVVVFVPGKQAGEPGRLRLVSVKILQQGGMHAAVSGNLKPGEQVVVGQTAVLAQLREGDSAVAEPGVGSGQ